MGMQQMVHEPTRGEYLLDLVMSDVEALWYKVLPKIADHGLVCAHFDLPVPVSEKLQRTVWQYVETHWEGLCAELEESDWAQMDTCSAGGCAEFFTSLVVTSAEKFIPKRILLESKSSHPWVNDRVIRLVNQKQAAAGTEQEQIKCEACSAGLKEEFDKYVQKGKKRLQGEPRAARGWWSSTRRLLRQNVKATSIPALKDLKGDWCMDAKDKADLLAHTLKGKYKLPEREINCYTELEMAISQRKHVFTMLSDELAETVLKQLRDDSAPGPDNLPTRILRRCAKQLARPFLMLAKAIWKQSRWPELWLEHWIYTAVQER
jgi:hypothetical protein